MLITAFYIHNRVAFSLLSESNSLHHLWLERPLILGHFRLFDFKAWYTVPKANVPLLEESARKAIFLEHFDQRKDYKLIDTQIKQIIVAKKVVFDELSNV